MLLNSEREDVTYRKHLSKGILREKYGTSGPSVTFGINLGTETHAPRAGPPGAERPGRGGHRERSAAVDPRRGRGGRSDGPQTIPWHIYPHWGG